jgi:hypothetical protein
MQSKTDLWDKTKNEENIRFDRKNLKGKRF